ncbi:AAA family ATPase [Pseudochrobactrum sp. sp1633]|uniref:AAA family ATPase n=1 Tax=Pseudochrobactrum sp. sp1633 TaxID=3036706 RepID=UPI0025A65CDC|nr:AAA family ATPase [Pseudochrobactrum sp. sp1633]MDM8344785.1 AAA family ATPase [Pseudochrobactrum sp. sp1633]HWD13454.1 AAA family ATPase [Pseudochrobactrum sp.]
MLIILGGLPGSGKSTIAKLLAEKLAAVYLHIDTIEQAISASSLDKNPKIGPEGYFVAYDVARENLRLGLLVIIDSVNAINLTRKAFRDVAVFANVPFLEVEIYCSNQNEHRSRVESRIADNEGKKSPDWHQVISRNYEPWETTPLRLDSFQLSALQCANEIISVIKAK